MVSAPPRYIDQGTTYLHHSNWHCVIRCRFFRYMLRFRHGHILPNSTWLFALGTFVFPLELAKDDQADSGSNIATLHALRISRKHFRWSTLFRSRKVCGFLCDDSVNPAHRAKQANHKINNLILLNNATPFESLSLREQFFHLSIQSLKCCESLYGGPPVT